jgi:carbon-monoxide dehydrogenase large subunit
LLGVDLEAARAVPGVLAAFAADDLGELPAVPATPGSNVPPEMARPALAHGRVRFVGEAIAAVVAETLAVAEDAAELVLPDLDPLPTVGDVDVATAEDAQPLFEGIGNVAATTTYGADVARALDAAPVVIERTYRQPRVAPGSIETRRIVVVPDGERLTVWCSHQAPHRLRDALADAFGRSREAIRVISPDVGGAFGAKSQTWPEYLVVAAAAMRLGRPVRWVEGRGESFVAGAHGRAQRQRLRLAADDEGRFLALDAEIVQDVGAYPHTGALVANNTAWVMSGPYRIPEISATVRAVVTNATPTAPYRGAGRPEAAYALERIVDDLARRLRIDPAELRRRNFIPPDAFPYRSPTGAVYDGAHHAAALDRALALAEHDAVREEQRSGSGTLVGLGIGCYVERSGEAPGATEFGAVEITARGRVFVRSGTASQGQGHATSFAQIAASVLGVRPDDITVVEGDTEAVPQGRGTFASRSTQIGGSALHLAAMRVIELARAAAAADLEVSPEDLVLRDGGFEVVGSPARRTTLAAVAASRGGFEAREEFASPQAFPSGAYVAVVDVDPDTGEVTLRRIAAVDDCGTVVNPLLAEGQVIGSAAQGIAQALFEEVTYDDGGPTTTSFATYAIPAAPDLTAELRLATLETPAPHNPLGAKGAAEAGCIGAPPAIVNAVLDALRGYDASDLELPITSERVWMVLRRGRSREGAAA